MSNAHQPYDLAQKQSLPLEAKERMSEQRIKIWFESWVRYTIVDAKTGEIRTVTHNKEPNENGCFVKRKKKIDGKTVEIEELVKGTKLKPTEYINAAEDGQVYVSFSGGKDSTVLADLCARVCKIYGWTLYLLFVNTGLEYPEIQKFVKNFAEWLRQTYEIEVVLDIVRPEMRFDEVLKRYGYPVFSKEIAANIEYGRKAISKGDNQKENRYLYGVRKNKTTGEKYVHMKLSETALDFALNSGIPASSRCCSIMKKKPADKYSAETGRKSIQGTLAAESKLRELAWIKNGCNAFESKNATSRPLSFWTNQDILHYLKIHNIPYCSVYGDIVIDLKDDTPAEQINIIDFLGDYEPEDRLKTTGCDRTGCIFCMFGCHLEKEPNRFQRLKETHPRQYEYCIGGGEYITEGYAMGSSGEWRTFVFEHDDGTPFTQEEIDKFVKQHESNPNYQFRKKLQPSKKGLGLGYVLDYIGVKYE